MSDPVRGVPEEWANLIVRLGGNLVSPLDFDDSLDGLERYLRTTGMRFTSVREMTRPGNPAVAKALRLRDLRPPRDLWHQTAGLVRAFDTIREVAGVPLVIYNAYRPKTYNDRVHGAPASDHISNHAIDIRIPSQQVLAKVTPLLAEWWRERVFRPSIGIGSGSTPGLHVGLLSPKGQRRWRYDLSGSVVRWHAEDLPGFVD